MDNKEVSSIAWGRNIKTPAMKRKERIQRFKGYAKSFGRGAKSFGSDVYRTGGVVYRDIKATRRPATIKKPMTPSERRVKFYKKKGSKFIPVYAKAPKNRIKKIKKQRTNSDPFGVMGNFDFDIGF